MIRRTRRSVTAGKNRKISRAAIPTLLGAVLLAGMPALVGAQTQTDKGITVTLPAGWKFATPPENAVFLLQATEGSSTATCKVTLETLEENTTSQAYAEKARSSLSHTFPMELIQKAPVFTTKIGGDDAAGFTWVHAGSDGEVMVFAVKGTRALTLDFEKMQIAIDEPAMKAVLAAVHF